MEAVLSGRNVFFTGSAGVGKSLTMKVAIEKLRDKHGKNAVYVTASTGVAACNLNGTTLHSFAGAGLGKGTLDVIAKKIATRADSLNRWRQAKVLIVDEVSMITNDFFELLDKIGRRFRPDKHLPFGGIQLVLCGDFCQLGSINDDEMINPSSGVSGEKDVDNDLYLFESILWNKIFPSKFLREDEELTDDMEGVMIHLTQIYRQKDEKFVSLEYVLKKEEVTI